MDPSSGSKSGRGPRKPLNKNKSLQLHKKKLKQRDEYAIQHELITKRYDKIDPSSIKTFKHFPLTLQTLNGLKKWKYFVPTDIQRESIGLALQGHDILGAAKTGSGKTLAFVIPVLECLFCAGWSRLDGLGSLIITPTRELAYQIFEVFNKVGAFHNFSVALTIGGKDLIKERKMLDKCNIVICTPGRLLQHMDENPLFSATNMQILVLDEADRILDMGFQQAMNAIIENLPEQRQTLLFSATQTKSVKDLARLSLKNPMYVSVHEHAKHSTPENLQQSYLVCEAQSKVDLLWSFLRSHKKHKILVFMSSCKQVKYAYEVFCRMKPGISVMALYGSLHQLKRMEKYDSFCRKEHVVMFATDIASRGLDFPNISWVIQLDCPEDVNTYIHRAGRTARYQDNGESLLILLPSERESMLKQLEKEKIPINEIKVSPRKIFSVQKKMEILCAQNVNLKESAQRAFKAYLKSVFLMKDKTVFDIQKIDIEAYAKSLGLAFLPKIRFVKKKDQKDNAILGNISSEPKNKLDVKCESLENLDASDDDEDDDFLVPKKSSSISNDEASSEYEEEMENSSKHSDLTTHELIVEKKLPDETDYSVVAKPMKPLTKAALAKKIIKKLIKPNTKIVFNEEGKVIEEFPKKQKADLAIDLGKEMMTEGYNILKAKLIMDKEDAVDKHLYREKIKQKHRETRLKKKEEERMKHGIPNQAELDSDSDSEHDRDKERMIEELPDPDKYYGVECKEEENDLGDISGDTDSEAEMDTCSQSHKRERKHSNSSRKKQKQAGDDILVFDDEEDLALQLLNGS